MVFDMGSKCDPEDPELGNRLREVFQKSSRKVADTDDCFGFLVKPLGPFKTAQDAAYMVLMLGAIICSVVSFIQLNPLSAVISAVLALFSWHTLMVHVDRVRLLAKLVESQENLQYVTSCMEQNTQDLKVTETSLKRVEAKIQMHAASMEKNTQDLKNTESRLQGVPAKLLASMPSLGFSHSQGESDLAEKPLRPPTPSTEAVFEKSTEASDSTCAGDSPAKGGADLKDGSEELFESRKELNVEPTTAIELDEIIPEEVQPDSLDVQKKDWSVEAGPVGALKTGMGQVDVDLEAELQIRERQADKDPSMNAHHSELKPFSAYTRMHTYSMDGTEIPESAGLSHEDGLQVLMEHPETGQQKTFRFTTRPMGIQFWQSLPLCLTSVEGTALELGVEEGWLVKEFGEHDVSKFSTFQEAYEQFTESAGKLPQS